MAARNVNCEVQEVKEQQRPESEPVHASPRGFVRLGFYTNTLLGLSPSSKQDWEGECP